MSILIGDTAPDFEADTSVGPIRFHDWIDGSWAFLFSHPADSTPVCTTEMGRAAQLADLFDRRGTRMIGLSTGTVAQHRKWITEVDGTQNTTLRFPIVADPDLHVARRYGMIHPQQSESETVRAVFIIDPHKRVRLTMAYPPNVGRNFIEILRVIDALQLGDRLHVATPADWRMGEPVLIPPSTGMTCRPRVRPAGATRVPPEA